MLSDIFNTVAEVATVTVTVGGVSVLNGGGASVQQALTFTHGATAQLAFNSLSQSFYPEVFQKKK